MIKDTEYRSLCDLLEEFRKKSNAYNFRYLNTHISFASGKLSEYAYVRASLHASVEHGRSLEGTQKQLQDLVNTIETREGVPISKILQDRGVLNRELEDWLENPVEPQR